MPDYWRASGYRLLTRDAAGHLVVTDDFLRAYLLRPELAPVAQSDDAELRLHDALLAAPRRAVSPPEIAAIGDADVRDNIGICYGIVVRSMGAIGGMVAGFKGMRRGEIPEYTQLLEDSRRHAIDRMVDNARLMDADAIIAVRFDSSEIGGQFTEIVAYGTAVKVGSRS